MDTDREFTTLEEEVLELLRMDGETIPLLLTMLPLDLRRDTDAERLKAAVRRLETCGLVHRKPGDPREGVPVEDWWELTEEGRAVAVAADP